MPTEIFSNPTVKEVAFEIRFPILFSVENKIGNFQELVMSEFPEAQLHYEKIFAAVGPEPIQPSIDEKSDLARKVWVFKSGEAQEVRISSNTLTIISMQHKSYDNPNAQKKFRNFISFALENFFKLFNVPVVRRVGLRYIDHCPLPVKDNDTLTRLYNSVLPYERFPISNAESMYVEIITKRKSHNLIYREKIVAEGGKSLLILDFDGYETQVAQSDILKITDELHEMIDAEYFAIVKEPVLNYMKTGVLE
jgi:uncharacterized protein (TIGR04255 family)